ncbi:MAG: hypothetical protein WEE89_02095 [Gemmatimonadota bacterium]
MIAGGAGGTAAVVAERGNADTLRIVSYNIEFALRVDSANSVLTTRLQFKSIV